MMGEWTMSMSPRSLDLLGTSGGGAVARRAIDYHYQNKTMGRMTESRYRLTLVDPDTGPIPIEVAVVLDHEEHRGFVVTALECPNRILGAVKTLKEWDFSSEDWDRMQGKAAG